MKGFFTIICSILVISGFGQIPSYYNDVNLTLSGMALKAALSQKIIQTHTNELSYSNVWTALKETDLDPNNSNNVLLLYGYNDSDGSVINDRTRDKDANSGDVGDWNREHTFPKSIASPSMSTNTPGAGTDAHHLRSTDVQMNNNRASRKFASGSGNSGAVGANWYPGDEWKGDVARMMMYMYLRYPGLPTTQTECLLSDVGVGTSVAIDADMITLFLDWNAEDTVSVYETNRNNILQGLQGNRNPFIDNPYLATVIWSGVAAQDKWDMTSSITENDFNNYFTIYPNPSSGNVNIDFKENRTSYNEMLEVYSINGKKVRTVAQDQIQNREVVVEDLPKGMYIFKYNTKTKAATKKVVIN